MSSDKLIEDTKAQFPQITFSESVETKSLVELGILDYVQDYAWHEEFSKQLSRTR